MTMRIITVISSSSRRVYYIKSVLNYVGHHIFYCKFNNFFFTVQTRNKPLPI